MIAKVSKRLYEKMQNLAPKERLEVIDSVIRHQLYGEELSPLAEALLKGDKRATTSAENGRKGGRPKGSKNLPKTDEKPKIEEIEDYIRENHLKVNAEEFFKHYEDLGWKTGEDPIKSWKGLVWTWSQRDQEKKKLIEMLKA